MGTMSASDAAPLPRLGEVFFDVRGNSRSMRLSWYADTGVAVLSIWQGGMCTGTFRLAIADLPRMVQTLQRGPGGQRPERDDDLPGQAPAGQRQTLAHVRAMLPPPGEDLLAEHAAGPGTGVGYRPVPPNDPRLASTQYMSRADDPGPGPADHGAPPDYLAGPPGHGAASSEQYPASSEQYPAARPDPRSPAAPDYLADPLDRSQPPGYQPDPPAGRPPAPDYLADPLDRSQPPGYRPGPAGHRAEPADYLADPPGQLPGAAGYPPERPGYADPPARGSGYLPDLPIPSPAGPGEYEHALHPGTRPAAWNPGEGAAYRRDGEGAGYAGHAYSGAVGPADYRSEPAPHYRPGSSAADVGHAPRSSADYPAHYAGAVTGDDQPGSAEDSHPYGRPPARRRAPSRHSAPGAPFD